jgi:hypothetical protein
MKLLRTPLVVLALLLAVPATASAADPLISTNKPATASSVEGNSASFVAAKAFDQNTSTRWSSAQGSDGQWLRVDLGATYNVSRVRLNWEAAYGKGYRIEVSADGTNWTTAYTTTTGNGGIDDITGLSASGRYVRMYGTARSNSAWGYSLWEMEVYGAAPVTADPLRITTHTDHTASVDLEGYTVPSSSTQECVWLSDSPAKTGPVNFYLDGALHHTENSAPWDYENTVNNLCTPTTFAAGTHTIRADWSGGTDSSTFTVAAAPAQCADGIDNDGDTKIDYPADPGCTSASDNDETDPAGGGLDPSGVPMPTSAPAGSTRIFSDNFPTAVPLGSFPSAVSTTWGAYPFPWAGTPTWATYNPEKTTSIHDGQMDMWMHYDSTDNRFYITAPFPRLPGGQDRLNGRYTIRYKADVFHGYHASYLLWPQSDTWPRDGEIDYPEADFNESRTNAFVHLQNATSGGDQVGFSDPTPMGGAWHTATTEWVAGQRVTFFLDGRQIGQVTSRVPNTPMHWVIQNGGSFGSAATTADQGHVLVDWVTVDSLG